MQEKTIKRANSHIGLAAAATTTPGSAARKRRANMLTHINEALAALKESDRKDLYDELVRLERKIDAPVNHNVAIEKYKQILLSFQKLLTDSTERTTKEEYQEAKSNFQTMFEKATA